MLGSSNILARSISTCRDSRVHCNLDTDVLYSLVEWRVDTLFLEAFSDEEVDTFGAIGKLRCKVVD
jgi:hypothetical protein